MNKVESQSGKESWEYLNQKLIQLRVSLKRGHKSILKETEELISLAKKADFNKTPPYVEML